MHLAKKMLAFERNSEVGVCSTYGPHGVVRADVLLSGPYL